MLAFLPYRLFLFLRLSKKPRLSKKSVCSHCFLNKRTLSPTQPLRTSSPPSPSFLFPKSMSDRNSPCALVLSHQVGIFLLLSTIFVQDLAHHPPPEELAAHPALPTAFWPVDFTEKSLLAPARPPLGDRNEFFFFLHATRAFVLFCDSFPFFSPCPVPSIPSGSLIFGKPQSGKKGASLPVRPPLPLCQFHPIEFPPHVSFNYNTCPPFSSLSQDFIPLFVWNPQHQFFF